MRVLRSGKRLMAFMLAMVLSMSFSVPVFATSTTGAAVQQEMLKAVGSGQVTIQVAAASGTGSGEILESLDYPATKSYKTSSGGWKMWTDIASATNYVNEVEYNQLDRGSKQDFLTDLFHLMYSLSAASANGYIISIAGTTTTISFTDANVETATEVIASKVGEGSTILLSTYANAKPDFASANRILSPFMGIINTATAVIAIALMSLLGLHMALDIAYIALPSVQLICGGGEGGGQGGGQGGKKGIGGLVSKAAQQAVNQSGGQGGGGAGGGSNGGGNAFVYYLGKRWLDLVLIGICLLYLVAGNLWGGIAGILDLMRGFLGF